MTEKKRKTETKRKCEVWNKGMLHHRKKLHHRHYPHSHRVKNFQRKVINHPVCHFCDKIFLKK